MPLQFWSFSAREIDSGGSDLATLINDFLFSIKEEFSEPMPYVASVHQIVGHNRQPGSTLFKYTENAEGEETNLVFSASPSVSTFLSVDPHIDQILDQLLIPVAEQEPSSKSAGGPNIDAVGMSRRHLVSKSEAMLTIQGFYCNSPLTHLRLSLATGHRLADPLFVVEVQIFILL